MTTTTPLTQFDGPYSLLLSLIEEEKLSISEIALSHVTEQFLQYLDGLVEKDPAELADFLVVATRLLFLKSRLLLPQLSPDDESGISLEEQLRLYKRFVEASKLLDRRWMAEESGGFRVEPPRVSTTFAPPDNFSLAKLHESMVQLITRLTPPKPLPRALIDKAISMKEKIDQVRAMLRDRKQFSFFDIIESSENKTEMIVGFLALLELVKQRTVALRQSETFGDIVIERV